MIAPARIGSFGFGVSQQQKASHGVVFSGFSLCRIPGSSLVEWIGHSLPPRRERVRRMSNPKTPLETYIFQWSFDSNICRKICCGGMQMLESDHWYGALRPLSMRPAVSE
jgi:hypothetical protein